MISVHEHTVSEGPDETEALGRALSSELRGGEIILLRGHLGAGKSVLARGVALGLHASEWKGSPTFTLINEYETLPAMYHADLYRLTQAEVEDLGLEEYARPDSVLLVEWPERDYDFLVSLAASEAIDVNIAYAGPERRSISIARAASGGTTALGHRVP